jgi:hypothetical protein
LFNDLIEQIKGGDFGDDVGDIIADIDSYQYSSEEIASFNKYVKRSSAAFGYNDVYNNENGMYMMVYIQLNTIHQVSYFT